MAIKKYLPETINTLSKVIGNRIRLLERAEMLADATSFQRTAIIMSAVKLGVFDYLHKHPGVSANLVARDLNLNLISTERLLRVLESLGYLKISQNNHNQGFGYVNTQMTKNYLVIESPSYLGDYYNLVSQTWSSWLSLNLTIQTGSSNQQMDLFNGNDETLYEYYAFANEYLKEPSRELFTKIPLDQVKRIITGEVGITFIGKLLERKPDVDFVLAGLENQIDFLDRLLSKYPLPKSPEEIIISAEGNALSDQWGAKEEYDIVFLFRKLSYSDYGSQFIKKSFQVLRPKGMVIILEPSTDSLVPSPSFLPELEIMDLLIGGVKAPSLYSTDKIVNLLREVGFIKTEVVSTQKGSFLFVVGWKN
ncbi:methyltransferase dimerization domain-containing protein [Moorena sp. SIO3I8]|uniref:methyltransferase family protein n=1 Tax=Moorena sp. SIO3I8 TaxID=2607833 RepID=UPI0013C28893|nr:methyltransferase dimerization domain-containing protein [Moorena sp. SIO3I8]NEO08955.1 hypothetical protein [Moorena sp. SIO3I8]